MKRQVFNITSVFFIKNFLGIDSVVTTGYIMNPTKTYITYIISMK